jgi:hypothetical protein
MMFVPLALTLAPLVFIPVFPAAVPDEARGADARGGKQGSKAAKSGAKQAKSGAKQGGGSRTSKRRVR